ncbi:MAG: flagellar biosynthetic protein FliO [bacterium]|nr:flagellar biosynthetic protein FliO [bacterium]
MKILASIVLIFIGSFALLTFSVYGEEVLVQEADSADRALNNDLISIDNKTPTLRTNYEFNSISLIFKTIFALGLITSVIYLIFRFFMKGRAFFPFTSSSFIQVMGVAPLAPNKYIQLVEVANKILILGISGENINLLSEIKEKEVIDLIKTHGSRELGKEKTSFTHHLKTFFKGFSGTEDYNKKIDFLKKQQQRLKDLE